MNEDNASREKPGSKVTCDGDQYQMLLRCSANNDVTEWNQWREDHPHEEVWLVGADLRDAKLRGANLQDAELWFANLQDAHLTEANLQDANLREANLQNANLWQANLQNAKLRGANLQDTYLGETNLQDANLTGANLQDAKVEEANLQKASLWQANLQDANLMGANLQDANLREANLHRATLFGVNLQDAKLTGANLQHAHLMEANLQDAHLREANLQDANLEGANLQDARLWRAHLEGADLSGAWLEGADFRAAFVDGTTIILGGTFDRQTDFRNVGLDNAVIESGKKQLLKYNGRRMNWEDWYRGKSKKKLLIALRLLGTSPVRGFWAISDYGCSTFRIITAFFALATAFALLYYFVSDLVKDLHITGNALSDLIRACYFSIVTMTTLGFGDMYANPESRLGHILLMLQVLLGYILLAALVTRFAVLFTAGGPAAKFSSKRSHPTKAS